MNRFRMITGESAGCVHYENGQNKMTGFDSNLSPSALPKIETPCYQGFSNHGELIRNQQVASSTLAVGSIKIKVLRGFWEILRKTFFLYFALFCRFWSEFLSPFYLHSISVFAHTVKYQKYHKKATHPPGGKEDR